MMTWAEVMIHPESEPPRHTYFITFNGWIIFHWAYKSTLCLFIYHLLIDIWIVSIFWILWLMLLWTFAHNFCTVMYFHIYRNIQMSGIAWLFCNTILTSLRNCQLFFHSGSSFYISTSSVPEFQFLHIFMNIYYFWFFDFSQPSVCVVASHCDFDLLFQMTNNFNFNF